MTSDATARKSPPPSQELRPPRQTGITILPVARVGFLLVTAFAPGFDKNQILVYTATSDGKVVPVHPSPFPEGTEWLLEPSPTGPWFYKGKFGFGTVTLDEKGQFITQPFAWKPKEPEPQLFLENPPTPLLAIGDINKPSFFVSPAGYEPAIRIPLPAQGSIRKMAVSHNWIALSMQSKKGEMVFYRLAEGKVESTFSVSFSTLKPTSFRGELGNILEEFSLFAAGPKSDTVLLSVHDGKGQEGTMALFRVDQQGAKEIGRLKGEGKLYFKADGKMAFAIWNDKLSSFRVSDTEFELIDSIELESGVDHMAVSSFEPYLATCNNNGDVIAYHFNASGKLKGPIVFPDLRAGTDDGPGQYLVQVLR